LTSQLVQSSEESPVFEEDETDEVLPLTQTPVFDQSVPETLVTDLSGRWAAPSEDTKRSLASPDFVSELQVREQQYSDQNGPGFVCIFADRTDRFKIGSSKHPGKRFNQLRTGNLDLRIVAWIPAMHRLSAKFCAHHLLKSSGHWLALEWFTGPESAILSLVFEAVGPYRPPL
jgi:hypothetical protein